MSYALVNNTSFLDTAQASAKTLWDAFVAKMVLSTKRAQVTQMTQAMYRMDDAHLATIGITRSEVADYANMVIRINR